MKKLTTEELFKKYAPSGQKFFLHGSLSILTCIALGILYGLYFMDVPANLNTKDEAAFRQGMGLGFGIYLSIVPVTLLTVKYIYQLLQAKKKAISETA